MSEQPEALRLADILTAISEDPMWACHGEIDKITAEKTAAELRRLHAVNADLLGVLDSLAAWYDGEVGAHMDEPHAAEVARAAIARAEEVKP